MIMERAKPRSFSQRRVAIGRMLKASFHVQLAGNADRFWLISTGAMVHKTGEPAYELVNVEAVRVSPSIENTRRFR